MILNSLKIYKFLIIKYIFLKILYIIIYVARCRNVPRGGSLRIYECARLKIFSWLGSVFLIKTILWCCDGNEKVQILDLWHSEGDHKMNHSSYWSCMTIMKWSTLGVAIDHFGLGMIGCLLKPMFWVTKLKTSIPWSTWCKDSSFGFGSWLRAMRYEPLRDARNRYLTSYVLSWFRFFRSWLVIISI